MSVKWEYKLVSNKLVGDVLRPELTQQEIDTAIEQRAESLYSELGEQGWEAILPIWGCILFKREK